MDLLSAYIIPILGMGLGKHEYHFQLDDTFITAFEGHDYKTCNLEVHLHTHKKEDMITLDYEWSGWIGTNCDRCLTAIKLPLQGEQQMVVRLKEIDEYTMNDFDEVIYCHPKTSHLSLAKVFFDSVILSLPLVKTYDCETKEPIPCDNDVIAKLENEETTETKVKDNPIWDDLKNIIG